MKAKTDNKIDFSKTHKDLYSATQKIKEVNPGRGTFLSVVGQGAPGGPAFQSAVEKLYTLVYTAKFGVAKAKGFDFKVSNLECLYDIPDPARTPKDEWKWQFLVRIPEQLSEKDLQQAREAVQKRKELDTSAVKRIPFEEGRCLQTLHLGPYDQVGGTYDALLKHASENGLVPSGAAAHEIYLNDPHRVPPEKIKTIVRLPVREKK